MHLAKVSGALVETTGLSAMPSVQLECFPATVDGVHNAKIPLFIPPPQHFCSERSFSVSCVSVSVSLRLSVDGRGELPEEDCITI